ncbi:hypothetical protein CROQUDRAFT_667189 [Cronartium quercuum f. sp. fusiforme G11]|uniref:Roadblock/LAMTOR2 domain-containing protein n=1 Tax=Cronartium quercuum f. sp. fusiforme G11 TaxID=708437 RepID=A0A9P6NXM5_9BASI|nr:hypothetical protein CROQUDRAFT_667189 [Cronartium quercuum f. sp. fusiforme G11]
MTPSNTPSASLNEHSIKGQAVDEEIASPSAIQSTVTLLPSSTISSASASQPIQSSASITAPPEVEATIQRLSQHKNVRAVIILNKDGVVIRSAGPILQGSDGLVVLRRYASEARKMVEATSKSIEGMEVDDQLRLLRIRTRLHELLITPDPNFILVVVQDPTK